MKRTDNKMSYSTRLDVDVVKELKEFAHENACSCREAIEMALRNFLNEAGDDYESDEPETALNLVGGHIGDVIDYIEGVPNILKEHNNRLEILESADGTIEDLIDTVKTILGVVEKHTERLKQLMDLVEEED